MSAKTTSSLLRPDASGPNNMAARFPSSLLTSPPDGFLCATIISPAPRGSHDRIARSRRRADVAAKKLISLVAAASVSNTRAFSMIDLPPAAIGKAAAFGQPSRGVTSLKSDSPQFIIARAAAPILSPICGRARITTGG